MNGSRKNLQGQYAGFISRFLARLIDILIIIGTISLVTAVVNILLDFFGLNQVVLAVDSISQNFNLAAMAQVVSLALLALFTSTFAFVYTIGSNVLTGGRTPGKLLMGLRIVRFDGKQYTFGRAVGRFFAFYLAFIPLALGIFWVLIDDRRQGWHDKIANTCVIYDWQAREDEQFLQRVKRWAKLSDTAESEETPEEQTALDEQP